MRGRGASDVGRRTAASAVRPVGLGTEASAVRPLGVFAGSPEAPADLHVETLVEGEAGGPRGTLERLRPEPGDMLPKSGVQITGFRLSLFKGMGSTRGNAESGFIRSVDDAVDRFHASVVAHLEPPAQRRAPVAERSSVG